MWWRSSLAALVLTALPGQAVTPGLRLDVVAPPEVRVGERAHVDIALTLPEAAAAPLLVTPVAEGEALEVVRGRFMRGDALAPEARPLRFRLPVVGRAPGTSILRTHALAYVCRAERCEALEIETRVSVVVLAP